MSNLGVETTDSNEFLALWLQQLINNDLLTEKGFVQKLSLIASKIGDDATMKKVDISISSFKAFMQKHIFELKEIEENKALIPMK